ncbi:MAG: hypothetical protein K2N43_02530, partial [Lachnospiraceae bacterium]|nr:hypothetical protein [Lachnospiraceae bacterium]
MYGESSFTWEYVCGYETREQRKRRLFRRAYALTTAVCIVSLTAMISVKLAAAGGVRFLTDKLRNTGKETAAGLPLDGEETNVIPTEGIAAAFAIMAEHTA